MDAFELGASELARAIRERRISSVEAVDAHLAQIERKNGALCAIITLDAKGARARAAEADAALARGEHWGPLHGVPFTLKDCHATASMRTTVGYPPLADTYPTEDGTISARMKSAGGILLGKTNVPPLLAGVYTQNPIFGRTNNPFDLQRTPGGSSGGSAAAVAARMIPIDIGSDAVGSVRLPAHFCGLFGLKPSERRISLAGHFCFGDIPGSPRSWRSIATIGPLARSIEDLELAFSILAGADGIDTDVPPLPTARVETPAIGTLRVAWAKTLPGVPVSRELAAATEKFATELDRAGARVEERVPELDYAEAFDKTWALVQLIGTSSDPAPTEPGRLAEYVRLFDYRDTLIRTLDAFMRAYDLLVLPPAIATAFPHSKMGKPILVDGSPVEYRHAAHHCALFNLSGQPAVVLPYTNGEGGLPIGVQLVGRRWQDEKLLAAARAVTVRFALTAGRPSP